jgi:hypothetical protein
MLGFDPLHLLHHLALLDAHDVARTPERYCRISARSVPPGESTRAVEEEMHTGELATQLR